MVVPIECGASRSPEVTSMVLMVEKWSDRAKLTENLEKYYKWPSSRYLQPPTRENPEAGENMLRRKPTKIEVKAEDKEELEEARRRAASAASASSSTAASSLLHQLDRPSLDPSSKSHRIGLSS
ncbi:anaphase-promoting complex subunit CDC26 [Striga asiatica]|uniref:Anaphase-promoting complex subunit CDC26 n=1 Tax=Striga asiatica TaxID=4170 RepID=A0A5A7PTQ0_STRAF|nr:anaphase-promoting complex subunit CDC26 [Striga asiatica]